MAESAREETQGWRPLQPPHHPRARLSQSPFARLATAHGLSVAGDTLLTMSLAGSLFFSISPTAAKGKVALYLLLTMAPFAVVAPLLGPVLDRTRSGRRLVLTGAAAGRAVLCFLMARHLYGLLLFPEAFAYLVLSKAHIITKSALVPTTVVDQGELVGANSKLQLLGVGVGALAAGPGAVVLKLAGAAWVLRLASLVFLVATAAGLRIAGARVVAPQPSAAARAELRSKGVVLAASAMGLLRAAVGFLTFLVAFSFRRQNVPSWWFGVVLAATMTGTFVGAGLAPRLRLIVREERILLVALVSVAAFALLASRGKSGLMWAAVLAGVVGMAASAAKLAFDAIVQRDAPEAARGRSFAGFETRFQLLWVVGAFVPVVLPVPAQVGFLVIAIVAALAAVSYLMGRGKVRREQRQR